MYRFLTILLAAMTLLSVGAQTNNHVKKRNFQYWGKPERYLNTQASVFLDLVDETLDAYPPSTKHPLERRQALYLFDAVIHETPNDTSAALHDFAASRVNKVIADLNRPMKRGMRVYKIYNDGFIVRTKSTMVAFDLCGKCGSNKIVPDSLMRSLVDKCEALFITHNHSDHADRDVVKMFIDSGTPVYAIDEFWADNAAINHIRHEVPFDTILATTRHNLKVKIFPGHQDELQNNIYVVTMPEGYTVAHTGDEWEDNQMDWIPTVSTQLPKQLDVLIVDCWAYKLNEFIKGFNPKVVVTGHENELGHTIDHREAFWLTYYKMETLAIPTPYVIMSWGEWYDYK